MHDFLLFEYLEFHKKRAENSQTLNNKAFDTS